MPNNEESNTAKELKYEGLTAIIISGQEAAAARHLDLQKQIDRRFDASDKRMENIEDYNVKQNGRQADFYKEFLDLKKETDERKLTCAVAVKELQRKAKYTKFLAWVDAHQKRAAIFAFIAVVGTQVIVLRLLEHGTIGKLWKLLMQLF